MRNIPDTALIASLGAEIDRVLATLIPRGTRVALINFPNHRNAGDPALWLGEETCLRRIGGRVIYRCSWASYRREDLARVLRADDVIFLHAGGNFGDLYLHNQASTRLRVLEDFPRHRTIQLPQSIWFHDIRNVDRLKSACEAHTDFTLMVREGQSQRLAQDHFRVPIVACPDMAFALGALARERSACTDVLWLARGDVESSRYKPPDTESGVEVTDWLGVSAHEPTMSAWERWIARLNGRLHERAVRGDDSRASRRILASTFSPVAHHWVRRGCWILSRGRVVVTDRLHGHILSMLMGIPHVVLDNAYGKNRAMFETWTQGCSTAHWANDAGEALALARKLARRG